VACLRMAHRITEDENVVDAAVAGHADFNTAEAARAAAEEEVLQAAGKAAMQEDDGLGAAAEEAQALPDGELPAAEAGNTADEKMET
jgi:hypothetical protein